jgi:3-deoxy-manno-octulosonate cytidylyltransferase (CMP-KDO synthetase)
MSPRVLGVIPARLGSSRLPRKPLLTLAGRPLIEWVWRRAEASGLFDALVVGTDSEEIADAVRAFGGAVEMTDIGHPSGTDRVAEVATLRPYTGYPIIVNVQGDEPFVKPPQVKAAVDLVRDEGWDVGTAAMRITDAYELKDPGAVKVVLDDRRGALLFSRAPIPFRREGTPTRADFAAGRYLRHLGIYAYTREALLKWVSLPESPLEQLERLEQLRPLAAGIRIGVALVEGGDPGVDTPEDARRAERRLIEQGPQLPAPAS